jgi:hypothetical protein
MRSTGALTYIAGNTRALRVEVSQADLTVDGLMLMRTGVSLRLYTHGICLWNTTHTHTRHPRLPILLFSPLFSRGCLICTSITPRAGYP